MLSVFILIFLLCLSSLCVMYPMSPVFILLFFCFVCHHSVSCTHCCPCSFLFFLLCLSSFCVMYPMLSVFILNCCCFVCLHSVSCTQCCPCSFLIVVALFVFILCHVPNVARVHSSFFLLCLSSFCVMYPMLSVFILLFFCFVCHHSVSCTQCCPCSFFFFFALFVIILCHVPNVARVHSSFFLLCLSSFCVMYPMLSVFILIFFALFVIILCHVPNVVRVHS